MIESFSSIEDDRMSARCRWIIHGAYLKTNLAKGNTTINSCTKKQCINQSKKEESEWKNTSKFLSKVVWSNWKEHTWHWFLAWCEFLIPRITTCNLNFNHFISQYWIFNILSISALEHFCRQLWRGPGPKSNSMFLWKLWML